MRWPTAGARPLSPAPKAPRGPPRPPPRGGGRGRGRAGRGLAKPPSPPRPRGPGPPGANPLPPAPPAAGARPAPRGPGLRGWARRAPGGRGAGSAGRAPGRPHRGPRGRRRDPRAGGAPRAPPPAMGRVLGLDRAPEVKTIRRKIGELAAAGKAAGLQMAIARHRARARPGELGFMYIDGHTRAYFGKRDVQKMHVSRLKFPGPATEETWGTDGAGDPLLVVMAEPSSSLAAPLKDLLTRLRESPGPDRKPTLCFDRGGWSPDLFAEITDAGFHLLTYRKASPGEDIPDLPADAFTTAAWAGDDGREHRYELADGTADITVTKSPHKGRVQVG